MRADQLLRKPHPSHRIAALIAVVWLSSIACSRPAPPAPAKTAPGGDRGPAAAPIEMPRTVMRPLPGMDRPPKPAPVHSDLAVPGGGESPRFPRDYAIGQLGAGSDWKAAYLRAKEALSNAAAGKPVADLFAASSASQAAAFSARLAPFGQSAAVRAGSPAPAGEGGVSFLFRVLGASGAASGEIHLLPGPAGTWLIESATLDPDDRSNDAPSGENGFDPLLYKRFL